MTAPYGRSASVEWASNIRPKRQVWLWEKKIPVGTASALAGRGGTGKTTYALHMVAQLSRGLLPGKYYGDPRPSLVWSGEDQWDTVIVPRIIAAGADLSKVGRLAIESNIDGETHESTPKLPLDTSTICDAIAQTGAALVLIDPIASTMSGDLNREADVRAAVDGLARVASETGAVMMFVRHFGKGGGNASDKMSGSHAFRDAVRSVFLFAADEDRVIVSQDKGNYAPPGEESFAFRLDSVFVPTDDGPAEVARVIELGASETSVGDVINRTDREGDGGDSQEIDEWIRQFLATGSKKANDVYSAVDAAGYSKDQAKRAKKRLGIKAERPSGDGPWFWSLTNQGSTDQGSAPLTRQPAPLLPCTSGGVQNPEIVPREHPVHECSLGTDQSIRTPAAMPRHLESVPAPKRQRQRTRGKFRAPTGPDRCDVCGWHTPTQGHYFGCSANRQQETTA
jgi:AAA domain